MKKALLSLLILATISYKAQAFTEGFESFAPTWTFINNGSTNPNEQWGFWGNYFSILPHSGNTMAGIQYSSSVAHNDYMISPKFTVISGVSDKLSFYAINQSDSFPEKVDVLLSETTPTATAFTATIASNVTPNVGVWTKYTYDLTPYVGKEVYIAFHSTTFFQWFIGIDDFEVYGSNLAVSQAEKNSVKVFPNPFTDVVKVSDVTQVKSIVVTDNSGRKLHEFSPNQEINLASLKSGLYMITVNKKDGTSVTFKQIKK